MTAARIVWPPHPFRAGFCVTDDTDQSTLQNVKGVYSFLAENGFRTSKTVWAFEPEEKCGIPPRPEASLEGITLEDPAYLAFCKSLHEQGFEICLHGASGGNNRRERMERAFELIHEHFGDPGTYICHSKNADNIYWERNVTSIRTVRWLLGLAYSKRTFEGEIEGSRYFWGDLCQKYVRQIRLFRTRKLNTLAASPSMPYFDPGRPFVNGWFAATKRSLADCASPKARSLIKREYGLTVLYHYMHKYADESGNVPERVKESVRQIADDPGIYVDTVDRIMSRLRQVQGLFTLRRGESVWIVNTASLPVEGLQIVLPKRVRCLDEERRQEGNVLVLELDPASVTKLTMDRPIRVRGPRSAVLPRHGRTEIDFAFGRLYVNLSETVWPATSEIEVESGGFVLDHELPERSPLPMSRASRREELRLILGQIYIIAREMLLKGRLFNSDWFPTKWKIPLHDQAKW